MKHSHTDRCLNNSRRQCGYGGHVTRNLLSETNSPYEEQQNSLTYWMCSNTMWATRQIKLRVSSVRFRVRLLFLASAWMLSWCWTLNTAMHNILHYCSEPCTMPFHVSLLSLCIHWSWTSIKHIQRNSSITLTRWPNQILSFCIYALLSGKQDVLTW